MRLIRLVLVITLGLALWVVSQAGLPSPTAAVANTPHIQPVSPVTDVISPIWPPAIRRWTDLIGATARAHGIDADLIAAVMNAESNGREDVISHAGAVGLMGVMPSSPGLEWRPTAEELMEPETNMHRGGAILSDVIQQSGGDIYAALAAYSGGWNQAGLRVPQEYAARVLDEYGRAVADRSGISPGIAARWTVAVELRRGHVPGEPLLFGRPPLSGVITYGEHLVYRAVDRQGHGLYVRGYAVPLALVAPLASDEQAADGGYLVEMDLMLRLNLVETKVNDDSNPRVLLACLPSLTRLRGRVSTRWYAPSNCPSWHRRGSQ
jgi:hypothetical protein